MTSYSTGEVAPAAASHTILSRQDFLTRVEYTKEQIRDLTSSIQQISTLHQRALSSPDSSSTGSLESLVTQTQLKNTQIRDSIKFLEADTAKTKDDTLKMKATQAKQLKSEFERELKGYQQEELQYRQRYREQIARQYRIVNPDATEAEVTEASEMDWGSEGVFQTAVSLILWILELRLIISAQIQPFWPSFVGPWCCSSTS
jgi:syntaxin 1B/2/3